MVPFSMSVRKALGYANQLALSLDHDHIAAEHVIVGLLREEKGLAAAVLRGFDCSIPRLGAAVTKHCLVPSRQDDHGIAGKLPQTASFKTMIGMAAEMAAKAGRSAMDTGDLLLALCQGGAAEPKNVLQDAGVDLNGAALRIAELRARGVRDVEDGDRSRETA